MLNDVVIAGKTYAKLNISETEKMDEIAIKVIRQDTPEFLLPIKMMSIDGETEIRFEISEGTRLNYLPETMTKRELITLLDNMLSPFKTCSDWFLDYHYFHLDKNYIMVGRDYSEVKYVYIPVDKFANSEETVLNFFRDFILNINLKDDQTYVMNLYRHIKDNNATLLSMYDYITRDKAGNAPEVSASTPVNSAPVDNTPVNPIPVNNVPATPAPINPAPVNNAPAPQAMPPVSGPYGSPAPNMAGQEFGKEDVKGNLINNLFGEEEAPKKKEKPAKKEKVKNTQKENSKGLFGGFGGNKAANNAPAPNMAPPVGGPYGAGPYANPVNATPNAAGPYANPVNNTPAPNMAPVGGPYATPVSPTPTPVSAPSPYVPASDATFIMSEDENVSDGSKMTLELEDDRGYHFPKFVEIDLAKGYATIGRYDKAGNAQADYNFDASLSFISRRHFRIERNGEQYRIIDLGSANGTMVNNEILVANMPYNVQSGDRIILSKNNRITYRVR